MAVVTKQYEEITCDICGEEANGHWFAEEYLNGNIFAEPSCPIDLCEVHMEFYALEFSDKYMRIRGEGHDEKENKELISKMKMYWHEINR